MKKPDYINEIILPDAVIDIGKNIEKVISMKMKLKMKFYYLFLGKMLLIFIN